MVNKKIITQKPVLIKHVMQLIDSSSALPTPHIKTATMFNFLQFDSSSAHEDPLGTSVTRRAALRRHRRQRQDKKARRNVEQHNNCCIKMLDIDMLRPDKGGDPEKFREIQRRRFKDVTLIDRILEADAAWRHQVNTVDSLNAEYNKASKEIGEKMKAKDVAGAEPLKAAQLERGKSIEEAKKQLQELDETRDRRVDPNISGASSFSKINRTHKNSLVTTQYRLLVH
jgi:hypothetical protein